MAQYNSTESHQQDASSSCSSAAPGAGLARLQDTVLALKEVLVRPACMPDNLLFEALQTLGAAMAAELRREEAMCDHGPARSTPAWRAHDLLALLKATQIGKVVRHLRKHPSRCVASPASSLVDTWKHALIDNGALPSTSGANVVAAGGDQASVSAGTPTKASPPINDDTLKPARHEPVPLATTSAAQKFQTRPAPAVAAAHAQKALCGADVGMDVHDDLPQQLGGGGGSSSSSFSDKVEASRRRLREGYGREQAAKRRRTICLLRPDELPALPSAAGHGGTANKSKISTARSCARRGPTAHAGSTSVTCAPTSNNYISEGRIRPLMHMGVQQHLH